MKTHMKQFPNNLMVQFQHMTKSETLNSIKFPLDEYSTAISQKLLPGTHDEYRQKQGL